MNEFSGERILILGAGVMQGPAISIARDLGLFTVVVDGDPNAPEVSKADRFECIDLKDKEGIADLGLSLQSNGGLGGIMTAGTDFSATVAWAAEKLGLPGIPYEAALNASDKDRMRRCFEAAGVPSPQFTVFTGETLKGKLPALPFSYPAVVKPVDNMGARGCRRVDTPEELTAALEDALGFSRSGRAIVEEYMDGPEFSVDAIVYKDEIHVCGFADRHIFFPPYFIEMGHTMPSNLGKKETASLMEAFFAGIRALGISGGVGAAKGDLKLTPRGPMIGEIAARLSGGYMSGWTYPYASGVDLTRLAILTAMGRRPVNFGPLHHWTSAERAFISIPGKVRSIQGLDQARNTPLVKDVFLRAAPSSLVRFPENNVSKCGNVLSAAPDRGGAIAAAEGAACSVLIRLEAPNPETAAFLTATAAFPPGAYTPDAAILAALNRLPDPPETHFLKLSTINIIPFPEFTGSSLMDYMGRSPEESLEAVRSITGLALPIKDSGDTITLGRRFWAALIRGGYQGGAYFVDTINNQTEQGEGKKI
ncbi:ATP-grasp domain-containing protein [Treponema primitia]|nr:ATP-grasp domain-containing protein [Treponema primitia]